MSRLDLVVLEQGCELVGATRGRPGKPSLFEVLRPEVEGKNAAPLRLEVKEFCDPCRKSVEFAHFTLPYRENSPSTRF